MTDHCNKLIFEYYQAAMHLAKLDMFIHTYISIAFRKIDKCNKLEAAKRTGKGKGTGKNTQHIKILNTSNGYRSKLG